MSGGKSDSARAVAAAQTAQDVALQGLRGEVSDFQNKLLAPLYTPRDALSTSSHAKMEPVVTTPGPNGSATMGAAPKQRPWERAALNSDDLLQMT